MIAQPVELNDFKEYQLKWFQTLIGPRPGTWYQTPSTSCPTIMNVSFQKNLPESIASPPNTVIENEHIMIRHLHSYHSLLCILL